MIRRRKEFNFCFLSFVQRPDISAGALLSKTYEELILLLIQLRRQTDVKERMIERGMQEIQAIQVSQFKMKHFQSEQNQN